MERIDSMIDTQYLVINKELLNTFRLLIDIIIIISKQIIIKVNNGFYQTEIFKNKNFISNARI